MLESPPTTARDPIVCHCLQVRESQVRDCVAVFGFETVQEVKGHCGAGGGCTSCHRKIRDFLSQRRRTEVVLVRR
jgi:bacterioferritin-associated ferredoxin